MSKKNKTNQHEPPKTAPDLVQETQAEAGEPQKPGKISNKFYEAELARLQKELVKVQEWIKHEGLKVGSHL